jgi:peptide/nickel transport system permease protein
MRKRVQGKIMAEKLGTRQAEIYTASQFTLMSWKFCKHKPAVYSAYFIVVLYLVGCFCEFISPYSHTSMHIDYLYAPPQRIHFFAEDGFSFRPFLYPLKGSRNPITLEKTYTEDRTRKIYINFLVRGDEYKFWGIFPTNIHLFGTANGQTIFLLGTDSLGRDVLSRIIYGARVSLTIGLMGVLLSFVLGLIVGLISGYYGGIIDHIIQRLIEIIRSFPAIPLWMALSAAMPAHWSPLRVYFGITLVLALIGWTGLARVVRGKILSLRQEDYAVAAMLCGAGKYRVMFRHLLPNFTSHVIVSLTLSIPAMILAETALSFLGLGLRPPVTSWGVLLKEAQNIQAIAMQPWLLTPVIFVVLAVLAFNFVGDGMRDAADPYSK